MRATLLLATWVDALGARPPAGWGFEDGVHRRVPVSAARMGSRMSSMWVLADHLSRHGGTVIQPELGRAVIGQRPPGRARSTGLSTAGSARASHTESWSGTSLASRGLLNRSEPVSTIPVGLVSGPPLAAIAHRARRVAALAQPHPQILDVASMQAVAVAVVARSTGTPIEANAVISQIAAQMHTPGLHAALRRVPPLIRQSASPQRVATQLHAYPGAAGTVPVALTAFLLHPHDLLAAIRFAIHAGGHLRRSAVLAGALCGAYHGERALPQPITFPARLTRIADALAGVRAAD